MMNKLTIVGAGVCRGDVTIKGESVLEAATIVYASKRLQKEFEDLSVEWRDLAVTDECLKTALKCNAVIIASGDPLLHGIGSTAINTLGTESIAIVSAPSTMQVMASRLNMSLDHARVVSLHGHGLLQLTGALQKKGPIFVLTDKVNTPQHIAGFVNGNFNVWVGEHLGSKKEKITTSNVLELQNLDCSHNAIVVIDVPASSSVLPGRSRNNFEHKMITAPEVRAITLSKLRAVNGVLWDLGAGSGSVGIEAVLAADELRIYSIEKNPTRCAQLRRNFARHNVDGLALNGDILSELSDLPDPDYVFIGGGGKDVVEILDRTLKRCRKCIVLNTVTLTSETAVINYLNTNKILFEFIQVTICRAEGARQIKKAENPVSIFTIGMKNVTN